MTTDTILPSILKKINIIRKQKQKSDNSFETGSLVILHIYASKNVKEEIERREKMNNDSQNVDLYYKT